MGKRSFPIVRDTGLLGALRNLFQCAGDSVRRLTSFRKPLDLRLGLHIIQIALQLSAHGICKSTCGIATGRRADVQEEIGNRVVAGEGRKSVGSENSQCESTTPAPSRGR
jgi:hypothetical protein